MGRGDVILRLVELDKSYTDKEGQVVQALNKISTTFKRGEFVSVVGRSGSGKSTLINILGGLDTPTGGDYFCEGNNVTRLNEDHWDALRNNKIGFIFQEYHLLDYLTVYENVEVSLKYQTLDDKIKEAKVNDILEKVGLLEHKDKKSTDLSGGQRQRVAIARALVKDPDIILADEPTGALDVNTADEIIQLLKGLSNDRLVIVVTHDRRIANIHSTRVIEIGEGKFLSDLIKEDIAQTYQNTFKKTRPNNLRIKDKIQITLKKINTRLFRTIFTAVTLAIAFSSTIIFNGIQRGFTQSYDEYYNSLNRANSFSFDLEYSAGSSTLNANFTQAVNEVTNAFQPIAPAAVGYSRSVASDGTSVFPVYDNSGLPDLFDSYKVRLFENPDTLGDTSLDSLFIGESKYPAFNDEIIVTSSFIRDYYGLGDDITDLSDYVGKIVTLKKYDIDKRDHLNDVDSILAYVYETASGSNTFDYDTSAVPPAPYLPATNNVLNIPNYCYDNEYMQGEANAGTYFGQLCNSYFTDDDKITYFATYADYNAYMSMLETHVGTLTNITWDMVLNSNLVKYYGNDNVYTQNLLTYLDTLPELINPTTHGTTPGRLDSNSLVKRNDGSDSSFKITAVIENNFESQMYFMTDGYNSLFTTGVGVDAVSAYFSVLLKNNITEGTPQDITNEYFLLPLKTVSSGTQANFKIHSTDKLTDTQTCSVYTIDTAKNPDSDINSIEILGGVFTVRDYSSCKVNSESYQYMQTIKFLFGIFFNVLMFVSVIFFNLLLKVILQERVSEIGVYRSVGATSKDVKQLFFVEILIIIFVAIILSIVMIFGLNNLINSTFVSLVDANSRVITFAGMNLSLPDNYHITSISIFNLAFYITLVLGLLLFLSNRSVKKISDTKPIDILRDVN